MKNFPNIFLSLGSNIGNKRLNIQDAINELSKHLIIKKISSLYETEPLLYENQENFYNLVIEVEFEKTSSELLEIIKSIEENLGRKSTFRYGPRIIDIDILFFKNEIVENKDLTIPHYDWQNRRFVIEPLSELLNEKIEINEKKISSQNIKNLGKIFN